MARESKRQGFKEEGGRESEWSGNRNGELRRHPGPVVQEVREEKATSREGCRRAVCSEEVHTWVSLPHTCTHIPLPHHAYTHRHKHTHK